jgi:naphtho-gamma-pyrone polyketide synthase
MDSEFLAGHAVINKIPFDRILTLQGGETYHADSLHELYSTVIIDILRSCQDFVSLFECHRDILPSAEQDCRVLSFGSFDKQTPITLALQDHLAQNYTGSIDWYQHGLKKSNPANIWKKDDIAIVGMSGRFPGAENLDQFWEVIRQGLDMHREVS